MNKGVQPQAPVYRLTLPKNNEEGFFSVHAQSERLNADEWHTPDGQLAVDVFETQASVIVVSPMAGADAGRIEVSLHQDLLTIRGERPMPLKQKNSVDILHQECFWGPFSRTIVLPVDVKGDVARASYTNGVLQIVIPKRQATSRIEVEIIDE